MFVKLEYKSETEKAYQLPNGSWIPKSILDDRGLKAPYYKIKDWWLSKTFLKFHDKKDENAKNVLLGLESISIKMIDIPKDVIEYWTKYWSSLGDSNYEMEPRLWGNDCFEGEMSSRF
jgi:hypothetical protein